MGAEPHILVVLWIEEPKALLEKFRANFPGYKVSYFRQQSLDEQKKAGDVKGTNPRANRGGVPDELWKTVTILFTFNCYPNPEDCPNLTYIHSISAGFDHLSAHPMVTDTDVTITSSSGIHGPPIAEWVVMNWLVAARSYNITYEWQKGKKWGGMMGLNELPVRDHVGMKVGILGYGSIGRHIARLSTAMGAQVLAYTASPRLTPESRLDRGYVVPNTGDPDGTIPISWHHSGDASNNKDDNDNDKSSLHKFLSQDLDHLVICTPLTKETTNLLGATEFSILSKGSSTSPPPSSNGSNPISFSSPNSSLSPRTAPFVTNISRGKIIHQPSLISALHGGELRGAALDVTDPEPLPSDHPLWDAPNVQISPHVSWLGVDYLSRAADVFTLNLRRKNEGGEIVNVFVRGRGY